MTPRAAALDADLRRLHGSNDDAAELSRLHEEAAGLMDSAAARAFQLTHAWVYALVAGENARADALAAAIGRAGREGV